MTPKERSLTAARRIDEALARKYPRRPLLVGQAPGRGAEGWPAFFGGRSGRRLAAAAGVGWFDFVRLTERVNLLERWPGKRGKGDEFPLDEARASARRLLDSLCRREVLTGRRIIIVGAGTARAFDGLIERHDRFCVCTASTWRRDHVFTVGTLPHPSGIVTWWNEAENRDRAARFLAEAVPSYAERR